MRENQTGWGTSDPEPQAPTDRPACSVPPQPVVCPTELFMTKTELRKVWCEGRDAAANAAEPSAEESAEQWDAPTIDKCRRKMKELGAPEATLSAVIALLTDPQSNVRPSVMEADAGLLECCTDALCDLGRTKRDRSESRQRGGPITRTELR